MLCSSRALSVWAITLLVSPQAFLVTAADWATVRCPEDSDAVLPTPTHGLDDAVFTVCTEAKINSSLQQIYDAIIDFNQYPQWNTFVYKVDLPPDVQTTPDDVRINITLILHTTGLIDYTNTTSKEIITVLDDIDTAQYALIAWEYDDGLGGWGSRAEHPSILVDQGAGVIRYVSYETYYKGALTPTQQLLRENLQRQFEQQGKDLKAFMER